MDSLEILFCHLEDIAHRAEDLAKSPNLDDAERHEVHSLWDTAIAALQDLGVAYTQRDGTQVLTKPERPARWRILLGLTSPFRLSTAGDGAEIRKCLPDLGR